MPGVLLIMSNTVKTALLLGVMSALFLLLGDALGGAQELGPDHGLFRIVAGLARRAGLPQPRCYVIPQASPNAFATGRNPDHAAVAATEGILQMLDDEELEGVLAHELAHVKHREILIRSFAAVLAGSILA